MHFKNRLGKIKLYTNDGSQTFGNNVQHGSDQATSLTMLSASVCSQMSSELPSNIELRLNSFLGG
jgi:hypothetical protein